MDRHGKKSKAAPSVANGERSDMKAKARETLGRAVDVARAAVVAAATASRAPRAPVGHRRRPA